MKTIRWRQRFANFEKAFRQLKQAVELIDTLDDLSKEGLIQRYEYTLELAWKTMKDFLESKEVIVSFPKDVIRHAFRADLIDNGELWMEMLKQRNLLSHTYDEEIFKTAIDSIVNTYFYEVKKLYDLLNHEQ